ncbi:MAG: hypothetical protein JW725_00285 [Candidatus Babeliaceae bacterium]|nr:hypothetical protein [Candidatus Babeliaceae bacterium]
MFIEIKTHLQQELFGIENHLSESKRKKLRSCADAYFYELIYCSINERDFAPLFSADSCSRPNAPVNTLVSSIILYIRAYSRTQLLVEVLIRLDHILSERDKESLKEALAPYIKQTSSAFVYSLKRADIPHELQKIANIYHHLYHQLKPSYGDTEVFKIFERVYNEHFCIVSEKIVVRDSRELTSSSLQSPDDIDAAFRNKRGNDYRGQVVNIAETANPENDLNLITDVAVKANNTDGSTILNNRIGRIKTKCNDLEELHTDGAYGSSDNDKKMNKHNVNHIQTAVRGRVAEVSIPIERIDAERHNVSCPLQTVQPQKTKTRFKACFDLDVCSTCEHAASCPAIEQNNCRVFYFTEEMVEMQKRVHAIELLPLERRKIRPNVEASVKEYTKAFNHKGKLRIRGRFKTMLFAFAMSIGINFGRIFRHLIKNPRLFPDFSGLKLCIIGFLSHITAMEKECIRCLRFLRLKCQRTGYVLLYVNILTRFENRAF